MPILALRNIPVVCNSRTMPVVNVSCLILGMIVLEVSWCFLGSLKFFIHYVKDFPCSLLCRYLLWLPSRKSLFFHAPDAFKIKSNQMGYLIIYYLWCVRRMRGGIFTASLSKSVKRHRSILILLILWQIKFHAWNALKDTESVMTYALFLIITLKPPRKWTKISTRHKAGFTIPSQLGVLPRRIMSELWPSCWEERTVCWVMLFRVIQVLITM